LVKVDHHLGPRHTLSVRYNFLDSSTDNFLGGGGRASPTSSTARDNVTRDQAVAANAISYAVFCLKKQKRVPFARRSVELSHLYTDPSRANSNSTIIGKSTSAIHFYPQPRAQLADSLPWTPGAHPVKPGVDINVLNNDSAFNLFFPARIVFPNLAAFSTFTPVVFWWPFLATATSYPGISPTWTQAVPSEWVSDTTFSFDHS